MNELQNFDKKNMPIDENKLSTNIREISKEYKILFNEITKAINQLEYLKNDLINAQIAAESQYIESDFSDSYSTAGG